MRKSQMFTGRSQDCGPETGTDASGGACPGVSDGYSRAWRSSPIREAWVATLSARAAHADVVVLRAPDLGRGVYGLAGGGGPLFAAMIAFGGECIGRFVRCPSSRDGCPSKRLRTAWMSRATAPRTGCDVLALHSFLGSRGSPNIPSPCYGKLRRCAVEHVTEIRAVRLRERNNMSRSSSTLISSLFSITCPEVTRVQARAT